MVGMLQAVSFVILYIPAVLHKSPENLDFLAPFKPFCVTINKADYIALVLNDFVFFYLLNCSSSRNVILNKTVSCFTLFACSNPLIMFTNFSGDLHT